MTPELTDLARRAVACKGWRWMPGMKDMERWRLSRELSPGGWDAQGGEWEYQQLAHHPKLPDLSDPATLGCLLALVREAWNDPYIDLICRITSGDGTREWAASRMTDPTIIPFYAFVGKGPTEAEALVKALESAPCLT